MKDFLKKHLTEAEYTTWVSSNDYITPNVSLIEADNNIIYNPYVAPDPYNGHNYVEIGGIKWATMNIGANNVTDYGLYFAWAETKGYSVDQLGTNSGQRKFNWYNYKYSKGVMNANGTHMTKYKSSDYLNTLEAIDDAVTVAWGSNWRMPTSNEYEVLINSVNTTLVNDYQGSGIAGLVCVDKTNSSNVLFFPAGGICEDTSQSNAGYIGKYWSSSLYTETYTEGLIFLFNINSSSIKMDRSGRYCGCLIRGVFDDSNS